MWVRITLTGPIDIIVEVDATSGAVTARFDIWASIEDAEPDIWIASCSPCKTKFSSGCFATLWGAVQQIQLKIKIQKI